MADAQPAVAVAPKPKKNDGVATAALVFAVVGFILAATALLHMTTILTR